MAMCGETWNVNFLHKSEKEKWIFTGF